jgi:hypothetical protein
MVLATRPLLPYPVGLKAMPVFVEHAPGTAMIYPRPRSDKFSQQLKRAKTPG